jgi:uncharacterized protein
MRNYNAQTFAEYLASAPLESRAKLQELRTVIMTAIPEAEESIKWGIPFYTYHGLLAGFSVFKSYLSFGFNDVLEEKYLKVLQTDGYRTGKKTIHINFDQKIPVDVITSILHAKAKSNHPGFGLI